MKEKHRKQIWIRYRDADSKVYDFVDHLGRVVHFAAAKDYDYTVIERYNSVEDFIAARGCKYMGVISNERT